MVSLIHISATYTRNAKEFGLAVTGQIEVMAAVSQLLTRAEAREFVNCVEYLREVASAVTRTHGTQANAVSFDVPGCSEIPIPTQMATPLGLILCEALAAAFLSRDAQWGRTSSHDCGCFSWRDR